MKRFIIAFILSALALPILGQGEVLAEKEHLDSTFGGWEFIEVAYEIPKTNGLKVSAYVEHDNYWYRKTDNAYGRFGLSYRPVKWLSFGFNYMPFYSAGKWDHFIEADIVGTLKSGDFIVSIRERYRYNVTSVSHELRSRLKVAYSIPNTKFGVYLAPEVFTWGTEWKKTRYYAAATYNITKFMQLECYYLYYAFKNNKAEHVIGIGFNFDFTCFNDKIEKK